MRTEWRTELLECGAPASVASGEPLVYVNKITRQLTKGLYLTGKLPSGRDIADRAVSHLCGSDMKLLTVEVYSRQS